MGSAESSARSACCNRESQRHLLEQDDIASLPAPTAPHDLMRSVIQFSTSMYFCTEDEGKVSVDIVRLGDTTGRASCRYETLDGSAKAGLKYEAVSGNAIFEDGEYLITVTVPIQQDDNWDSTLEFSMIVSEVRNALPGMYLDTCRVSIIDDDVFPTNKHKKLVHSEDTIESIPGFSLMVEYIRMILMGNRYVFWGTWTCIFLDFVKSMYFLLTLYLQLYLVDEVILGGESSESEQLFEGAERRLLLGGIHNAARWLAELKEPSREASPDAWDPEEYAIGTRRFKALLVGVLYITPFFILWCIDLLKVSIGVPNVCLKQLQCNLFRRFLNYKEETRTTIASGDITMAMIRDIPEVVLKGYMKVLEVVRIILKLMLALSFILAENKLAAVPLAVFPVILCIFLMVRERVTVEANEEMAKAQNRVVQAVNDAITNFPLISDFHLRPHQVHICEERIDQYNAHWTHYRRVFISNLNFAPSMTVILVGLWMVFGTFQVNRLGGTLTLGTFMATINVFKEIGFELQEIYQEFMEIQTTFGPLRKLTRFLNLPTDITQRMNTNRFRRTKGVQRWKETKQRLAKTCDELEGAMNSPFAVDHLPIELDQLSFGYRNESECIEPLLNCISHKFDQGRFYALVGPPHQGKATMLKLLGQVLVSTDSETHGSVLVPPHLRVLHVSREAYVLNGSLMDNIALSADKKKIGGVERIHEICRRCCFNNKFMSYLAKSFDDEEYQSPVWSAWRMYLSSTDYARLNLARAFTMNPEFLVMQMPVVGFNDEEAHSMLSLIRKHVDERGLEMPRRQRGIRRPRTVFLSSSSQSRCGEADQVFEVSRFSLVDVTDRSIQLSKRRPGFSL